MDSHLGHQAQAAHREQGGEVATARSRWAPKPEQILILESIFNSGMVNPAKDETARIRRLLERFGAVRDANVFYWFQNRRSRSHRRARQLQQACGAAAAAPAHGHHHHYPASTASALAGGNLHGGLNDDSSVSLFAAMHGGGQVQNQARMPAVAPPPAVAPSPHMLSDDVVDIDVDGGDDLFAISRQMGLMSRGGGRDQHRCGYAANDAASLQLSYQPTDGTTTAAAASVQVFINGVLYEVPGGSALLDLAGTFGRDAMLVHSSGEILPVNENGVLMKSLQMGECYYLVSRST